MVCYNGLVKMRLGLPSNGWLLGCLLSCSLLVGSSLLLGGCHPAVEHEDDGCPEPIGSLTQYVSCGGATPATPATFSQGIDALAKYDAQTTCDPAAKPGVVAFRDLVLATYTCTGDSGITRACNVGGVSEHKEGRAWDWTISVGNAAADDLIAWLLATDAQGNQYAMARRVGIMYIVWNKQIWGAYRPADGWRAYTGSDPHTSHMHISFTWDGANKKTSFWSGSGTVTPDSSVPTPDASPPPTPDTSPPPTPDSSVPTPPDLSMSADALPIRRDFGAWPDAWGNTPNNARASLAGGCAITTHHGASSLGWLLALLVLGLLAPGVRRRGTPAKRES